MIDARRTVRRAATALAPAAFGILMAACGGDAQQPDTGLVRSSDPALVSLASGLLPDLARRSGMELREPVRIEKRSRAQLIRYLEFKLDQELPTADARSMVSAYAMLGLVPDSLDLRALLLSLYTEQVAGFYEPDSTALFILDDQPPEALEALLIHELVHAVQDQSADLHALTDPGLGNDRATAAQAAIEGHATLVMFEFLTERMSGRAVDLAQATDFASAIRPALEGMRDYPALAGAPRVIQESLLFPYLEGATYVQSLWARGERVAPFGQYLPRSTEQVRTVDLDDGPVPMRLDVSGAEVVYEDDLGQLELGVLVSTHLGQAGVGLEQGWGGDRYALVDVAGERGLVLAITWDDVAARDRFIQGMGPALASLPAGVALESVMGPDGPAAVLRFGAAQRATVRLDAGTR